MAVAGLVLLFVLTRMDSSIGLILKFLLSKLVYSTSDGAVLFFLGFSMLALLAMQMKSRPRTRNIAVALLWGGILTGYGAHLAATLTYLAEFDIPLSAHVYHWKEGINSYTSLLHSHQGKAAMSLLSAWLPMGGRYDAGVALADAVPQHLRWLIGIGFVASASGALLQMPSFRQAHGHHAGLTLAYLIAMTTTIKSILDGGLFAYAVPPSLLLLSTLTFSQNQTSWRQLWNKYGLAMSSTMIAAYLILWIALTPGKEMPLLGPWLFFLGILALLSSGLWRGITAWIFRVVLLAYLATNILFDYGDNLRPLLRPFEPSDRIISFEDNGQMTSRPVEEFIGKPIFRAYRKLGDDPWKPNRVMIWNGSADGDKHLVVSLQILDWHGMKGEISSTSALRIAYVGAAGNRWMNLGFKANEDRLPPLKATGIGGALSRNNYYVWLYQIDHLLRQAGWQLYVLLPHTAGNPSLAVQ